MSDCRAVLFDLDGVLVDSYEAWYALVYEIARTLEKPAITRDRFQQGWGQGLDADLRTFFPGCSAQEIDSLYTQHMMDHAGKIRVEPGARDALWKLRESDLLRGVVTNTPTDLARDILAWVGLLGLVETTVGAGGPIRAKPEADCILQACDDLEVQPHEVVVVGDSDFDAQAARSAKAPFIGFRFASARRAETLGEVVDQVLAAAQT